MKYVVTDPTYILKEWDDDPAAALEKLTGQKAWSSSTGFGDWTNELYGPDVDEPYFAADSGQVCVCAYTDEVAKRLLEISKNCFALFNSSSKIDVTFDRTEPDWTVVYIKNQTGDEWHTFIPDNDDEDEEE